ncbi:MAG TPA: flagellar hook-associated protein 3 [Aquifex aeolicus]|nr:flagellar hook-associated protein 3 [Aquifex aeolicus]
MRVPDLIFNLFFQNENQKVRENIEEKYTEIITGKRILNPSDDLASTNEILNLKNEINKLSQFSRNRLFADTVLSYADTLLAGIEDRLRSLYATALRAANQTLTTDQLTAIGEEFEEALKLLLNTANEKIGNNYIFSGNTLTDKPFDEVTLDYTAASSGDFTVYIDENYSVSTFLDGRGVFGITTSDPAVNNIFKVIKSIADKLKNGQSLDSTDIENLQKSYEQISKIRAEIGSILKELRNEQVYQETREDTLEKQKSDVEDTDIAKSISDYERYKLTYDAIMKLFVNHKGLSILDYI